MPKMRDLGINELPVGRGHTALWLSETGCPGQSPTPCPGKSPQPCPGQSPLPCPGQSPLPCPGASPTWKKKGSGLGADAIAQLHQDLNHAMGSKFAQ